jgi:hypothetical protein
MNTDTTRYALTPDEVEALRQATPEQLVEAAAELAQDPQFWAAMAEAFGEGFLRGLLKD